MEETATFLNSPIFGVIVGGLLTVITTLIGQLISLKKEERLFDKDQEAKEKDWLRTEKKEEKEKIRDIYTNAISTLSAFIAAEYRDEESNSEDKNSKIQNIIDWVSILTLRYPSNEELHKNLKLFINSPNMYSHTLRENLTELIKREDAFFLTKPKELSGIIKDKIDPNILTVRFRINSNFRRGELIKKGIELNKYYEIDGKISNFTESQREKICQIYFDWKNEIPNKITLFVPKLINNRNKLVFNKEEWTANINPEEKDLSEILSSWEDDFNKELEQIEKQKKDHKS